MIVNNFDFDRYSHDKNWEWDDGKTGFAYLIIGIALFVIGKFITVKGDDNGNTTS
jgi:hypothetical protein